ncbi:alpha-L-fucosidase, partial [Streptomyces sp. BE303]|uniref:alpha-L-fucosidase n=1 Tax=Streptomyces sp. BE303 TaxID=3002528 RepID=UPI002E78EDA5
MTIPEAAGRRTALHEADAAANRQLTTLDGWRTFAAGPPEPPVLLSPDELQRLSPAERALYDEDRLDHHARMLVVATSFVEKTVVCGRRRWFWSPNDTGTKPISTLVRNLVTNSAYNTNDLLNVGPRPDGTLVPVQ